MIPVVLSIAGSDPSGGAGIQADLKTFSALGAYGAAAITALTAQNTCAVTAIHRPPAAFLAAQLDTLFADLRIDAIKIGMVGDAEAIETVADRLAHHRARTIVLDPVMVAKSGDRLLAAADVAALRRLLALAAVVTPNLPEAGELLGGPPPASLAEMRAAARALHAMGPRFVYLKGGHLAGAESPDLVFDGDGFVELPARRIVTRNTHGTGCTLSSAIAALLPQAAAPLEAFRAAKAYVGEAIAASDRLQVGHGHGPVHHFCRLWRGLPDHGSSTA